MLTPALASLSTIPQFDPKSIPAVARDLRFKAIDIHAWNTAKFREVFAPTLQALELRLQTHAAHIPEDARFKPSAVLVGLMHHSAGTGIHNDTVLFTKRSARLKKHSGQIALAGGKIDEADGSPITAALREAQEEIGLPPDHVEVIGCLPNLATGTGFEITPIIGLINPLFTPVLSEHEVSEIFEVPLTHFLAPANHFLHQHTWQDKDGEHMREWYSMPWRDANHERFIWGVTAKVMRQFYEFLHPSVA